MRRVSIAERRTRLGLRHRLAAGARAASLADVAKDLVGLHATDAGGWAQRKDGEIALLLLEDVGSDGRAAIGGQAALLADWLGESRFTPRFRTPLERGLGARLA